MRVDILTLFPRPVHQRARHLAASSGPSRAGALTVAVPQHPRLDHRPPPGRRRLSLRAVARGMVLKPEPLVRPPSKRCATRTDTSSCSQEPQGTPLRQPLADELAQRPHLVLVCGHYEGVDERVREHSRRPRNLHRRLRAQWRGSYRRWWVLDAVTRATPRRTGAAPNRSMKNRSAPGVLEYPHYTRPAEFRGWRVAGCAAQWSPRRHRRLAPRAGAGPAPVPAAARPSSPHPTRSTISPATGQDVGASLVGALTLSPPAATLPLPT